MAATITDLLIEQGANYSQEFVYRDSSGNPINLTGYTARMQIRSTYESASPMIDLTTDNYGIILGGAAGTVALGMSAATTDALTAGRGVYDLELISGLGFVTRMLQGVVTISRNVTR
jgi:hypothetical protein